MMSEDYPIRGAAIAAALVGFTVGTFFPGFFWRLACKIMLPSRDCLREPNPPARIKKLDDSVWEFQNVLSFESFFMGNANFSEMDVIFFHGASIGSPADLFWSTWVSRNDDQLVWPQRWLQKKFPIARILAVSYNSYIGQSQSQLDEFALGENLVSDIIDSDLNIGQHRPVFLVGHSLGGIVLKQLVITTFLQLRPLSDRGSNRKRRFLENCRGVFYYSTPHHGSTYFDLMKYIFPGSNSLSKLLLTLNSEAARINWEFEQHMDDLNLSSFSVLEGRNTQLGWDSRRIVEEPSARSGRLYTITGADHFEVCRPENEESSVITKLTEFIVETLAKTEAKTSDVKNTGRRSGSNPVDKSPVRSASTTDAFNFKLTPKARLKHRSMMKTRATGEPANECSHKLSS